ncbi:MAG TPA: 2-hydroxyacyl-CoA dehydratase [Candidatus Scatomorpha pullistercoris]|uniref:2-hydroxyacyl-CoA dehydratase n=1 Tax=Candidatus Scatomorpha pullistercoris TaxID=2840929 RepID=A0A9D1G6K7_9FIRM|nr:2-hydroxyacyl-CoA dehydratase [Candidatus Scatomorpha pullistercoris]
MKEILQKLDKLSTARPLEIIRKKKEGSKVVEFFGDFVPEQWITAAGAESYLIMKGGDPQPPEATLDYMLRFMNPLAASMAGSYLLGLDAIMPIADSVTIQQHDSHYGRMTEILEYKGLPVYKVGVPADYTVDISREYYRHELREFRAMLENLVGHPISDDDIRANYAKTNRINELLRKIDELRKQDNPPITFSDFIKLNHYTLRLDYDTSIEALEQIYEELKNAPGAHAADAPRILIMGRAVALGDYQVPTIIENAGGSIVCEFLDEAIRPFKNDISTEGDVVDAYASAIYDNRVPQCIFQPAWETRFEHLKELIKEYRIDGVLWYQLAFDEIYDMEHTCLSKWIAETGVPLMKLESSYEYSREAVAPLTTRLESFVESLKEAK